MNMLKTKRTITEFDAIIFDFDGVILNSEPLHYLACSHVLSECGILLSEDEYITNYLGLSDKEMFPQILTDKKAFLQCAEELITRKVKAYIDIVATIEALPFIRGLNEFMEYIHPRINKKAICSASTEPEIMGVLQRFPYAPNGFDTIVTAADVKHSKPSPEGYLLTATRLGVNPDKCLVIEDSPHGVSAAKAAGMYVIALKTSYQEAVLRNADEIYLDFKELGIADMSFCERINS